MVLPGARSHNLVKKRFTRSAVFHVIGIEGSNVYLPQVKIKKGRAYLTVESMLPVMTWGSDSWHLTSATVPVWPERT